MSTPHSSDEKLQGVLSAIKNNSKIASIDLSNCKLSQVPDVLYSIADSLEFLNLGGNFLSDLPGQFAVFHNLKTLFIPQNLFKHIPNVIGQLSSLYMFSMKSNQIETISEISLSPSIGWLILTSNSITELPQSIGTLTQLRKCMLAGNKLQTLPASMSQCVNLELIRLAANNFHEVPSVLFSLPKLSWMAMGGNPVWDSLPAREDSPPPVISFSQLTLAEKLGEGASGIVYKARLIKDNNLTEVAVKLFKGDTTSDGLPEDEMKACAASGKHECGIEVLGRLSDAPSNQQGLVLKLVPATYTVLGQTPTFASVTRDVYSVEQKFSVHFIKATLRGIASYCCHLHRRGITHGDLYGHNVLVEHVSNPTFRLKVSSSSASVPILGDFGAAYFYDPASTIGPLIERIEVRAFGCLIEELVEHVNVEHSNKRLKEDRDGENIHVHETNAAISISECDFVIERLRNLQSKCFQVDVKHRPGFEEIYQELALM